MKSESEEVMQAKLTQNSQEIYPATFLSLLIVRYFVRSTIFVLFVIDLSCFYLIV